MHLSNDFDHLSTHWTLPDTLAIGNLYTQIQFFVADFASCGFAKQGFGTINAPSYLGPFSSTERRRIERAFYRFELYCNLFRERKYGDDRFSPEEQRDIFFASYTPWENEQLACIHDYLFDRLSIRAFRVMTLTEIAFNDVAEHDIYWGEWYIPYFDDWDSPENFHKEGYLSLGLSYLHKIVTAETYEQRYDLISPVLRSNDNFLYEGLQTQGEDDGQPLPEYGNDAGQIYVDALLPGSEDFGPVRAWQWAHADSSRERYYFRDDQRVLRQSGYVMWDMSRISDWIELRWDSYPQLRSQIDDGEDERLRKAMQKSWSERSKVLQRGGRGWWAPGDESKVQWRVQVPIVKKVEADRSWTKKDQWINDMVAWRNKLGAGR
ncbi:hypothetical protein MMC11_006217 [Xylographa trunciseda]|nr:hypothetical protein [Xylographa trunciseda]